MFSGRKAHGFGAISLSYFPPSSLLYYIYSSGIWVIGLGMVAWELGTPGRQGVQKFELDWMNGSPSLSGEAG